MRHLLSLLSLLGLVLLISLSIAPRRAAACSCDYWRGFRSVPGDGALVPANLPAILVQVDPLLWDMDGELSVERVDGSASESLAFQLDRGANYWIRGLRYVDLVLRLDDALVEGARYRVTNVSDSHSIEFTTGPSAPLPNALGSVAETGVEEGTYWRSGAGLSSCGEPTAAPYVSLALSLSAEAQPWAEAMKWETLADDDNHRPVAYCEVHDAAQLDERVLAGCDVVGPRSVVVRGTIPGHTALESAPLVVDCVPTEGTLNASGCGVALSGTRGSLPLYFGLALAALWWRSRRSSST